MGQICNRCSRVNPPEASYCHFDGAALANHALTSSPFSAGSRLFLVPLVSPSGRTCRNFDELAMACQEEWPTARELLRQGDLEKFFVGTGRTDLARVARESARAADGDRGLDRLLGDLPTEVLQLPQLRADPVEVHLGVLKTGEDRRFGLLLENLGMRLLYGSISCEKCDWLAVGDPPGAPEKLFECVRETSITIHIKGKRLRAGNKPLEGQVLIQSNGGDIPVTIRLEVPVTPFPDGVLQGALTPRELAAKAKAAPKEAAAFFESGAVALWYKTNGWIYPVQGPPASGLGAVQQFFEALGLTPPPPVTINTQAVTLHGVPGNTLHYSLEVRTDARRPVFAHATSTQPWLQVERPRLNGSVATIPLLVPSVPDREDKELTAKVLVWANGNRRFEVKVVLSIGSSLEFPILTGSNPSQPRPSGVIRKRPSRLRRRPLAARWRIVLLVLLLLLILAGLLTTYAFRARSRPLRDTIDPVPKLGIEIEPDTQRLGLFLKDPDPANPNKPRRLTDHLSGSTSNVCVKIDDSEYLLGDKPGRRVKRSPGANPNVWETVFEWPDEQVVLTQTVDLVPGPQTRAYDTCRMRFLLENRSKEKSHRVGLRFLLDTFVGTTDGVPFAIPGQPGILTTKKKLSQKEIPAFVQMIERNDLGNPGTVAHIGLKVPDAEPLESLLICRWPGNGEIRWDIKPVDPIGENSCVVLFWPYLEMSPGAQRLLAVTYGLNQIVAAPGEDPRLGLTCGGDFRPNRRFTVLAYLKNPEEDPVVQLQLPEGLYFALNQNPTQEAAKGDPYSQVSWRVIASRPGDFQLEAVSGSCHVVYPLRIREEWDSPSLDPRTGK